MASAAPPDPMLQATDPDALYEVVDGQLVEMPSMGTESVWITSRIHVRLGPYVEANGLGTVISEGLFTLRAAPLLRHRPDVAFVSAARWPLDRPIVPGPSWDVVPDLAIEVVSPTDTVYDLVERLDDYFGAGAEQVWVVLPPSRKLYIYDGPSSIRVLGEGDELDGGDLVAGFRSPVASLFPPRAPQG